MYNHEITISPQLSNGDSMLFAVDKFLAGNLELSAETQLEANGNLKHAKEVAWNRIGAMGWTGSELVSRALEVYGLSSVAPTVEMFGKEVPVVAVLGFIGEGVSFWMKNKCINPIGGRQNTVMMQVLKETLPVKTHIRAGLVAAGFNEDQINKMDNLPLELYNVLFGTTRRSTVSNILNPILTGGAMIAYGDKLQGSIVAGLGLLGFPLGNWLYAKSSALARKFEASASARNYVYRMKVYVDGHFPQTERTNLLTIAPQFLKGIALLQGFKDSLARLTGINNALLGLSGLLTAMRTRYANERTIEMAENMIKTINSESFLFRKGNFYDHAMRDGSVSLPIPEDDFQGLAVRDIKVALPGGKETNFDPVSFDVAKGDVLVLKGKNGDGKSVLFAGIMQILEHTGHVAIAGENGQLNLHDLANESDPMTAIREFILSTSVRNMSDIAEITDILAPAFNSQYPLPEFDNEDDTLEFQVGMEMGNNLLRKEVKTFEAGNKKAKAVFSDPVMRQLTSYYEARRNWTTAILAGFGEGGSLSDDKINPERIVGTLSDGEQTALSLLAAIQQAKNNPKLKVALLDEPLRGLDTQGNLQIALDMIDELRQINGGISVVVITHEHDDALVDKFGAQVMNLSKPNGNSH